LFVLFLFVFITFLLYKCALVTFFIKGYLTWLDLTWCCWLGSRKGMWPVKNWVVGCWSGYLSGARCRFAYAQLMSLSLTVSCSSKSRLVLPSWLADCTTGRTFGTVCHLLSVTFCIVVKQYVLAKNCLKNKKLILGVTAIFLLPVSPLWPPRHPFLPCFCPYSPAIGTWWYKWTFWQDSVVRIETGSNFSHDYWPRKVYIASKCI